MALGSFPPTEQAGRCSVQGLQSFQHCFSSVSRCELVECAAVSVLGRLE